MKHLHGIEPLNSSSLIAGKYFGAFNFTDGKKIAQKKENDLTKGTHSILQNLNGCISNCIDSVGSPWSNGVQPGVILPVR